MFHAVFLGYGHDRRPGRVACVAANRTDADLGHVRAACQSRVKRPQAKHVARKRDVVAGCFQCAAVDPLSEEFLEEAAGGARYVVKAPAAQVVAHELHAVAGIGQVPAAPPVQRQQGVELEENR